MKSFKLCLVAITVIIFICYGRLLAQDAVSKNIKTIVSGSNAADTVNLPDLVIESIDLNPLPKEGEALRYIKINVANRGMADAGKCSLRLSCMVAKCSKGRECLEISRKIYGEIAVPPLKMRRTIDMVLKPLSFVRWIAGEYSLVAQIDNYNIIQESKEGNNISKEMVYITSFAVTTSAPPTLSTEEE